MVLFNFGKVENFVFSQKFDSIVYFFLCVFGFQVTLAFWVILEYMYNILAFRIECAELVSFHI